MSQAITVLRFLNLWNFKSIKIWLLKLLIFVPSHNWIQMFCVNSKDRENSIVKSFWGHLYPWHHLAKQDLRTSQDTLQPVQLPSALSMFTAQGLAHIAFYYSYECLEQLTYSLLKMKVGKQNLNSIPLFNITLQNYVHCN